MYPDAMMKLSLELSEILIEEVATRIREQGWLDTYRLQIIGAILLVCSLVGFFLAGLVGFYIPEEGNVLVELLGVSIDFIRSISVEFFGAGAILLGVEIALRRKDEREMKILQAKLERVLRLLEELTQSSPSPEIEELEQNVSDLTAEVAAKAARESLVSKIARMLRAAITHM